MLSHIMEEEGSLTGHKDTLHVFILREIKPLDARSC